MEADSCSLVFHREGGGLSKYVVNYRLPYATFLKTLKQGGVASYSFTCILPVASRNRIFLAQSCSRTTFAAMLLHCSLLVAVAHKVGIKYLFYSFTMQCQKPLRCLRFITAE